MGRPFCENFLILVKCPRDSRKESDWFLCEKISQKLKYLNFKCEQSERYFFVLFYSLHHSAHVPCEKFCWRQAKSVSGYAHSGETNRTGQKTSFSLFVFEVQIFQLLRNILTAKPIRLLSFSHVVISRESKIFYKMATPQLYQA